MCLYLVFLYKFFISLRYKWFEKYINKCKIYIYMRQENGDKICSINIEYSFGNIIKKPRILINFFVIYGINIIEFSYIFNL